MAWPDSLITSGTGTPSGQGPGIARFVGDPDVENGVYVVVGGQLGDDGTPQISQRFSGVQLQQIRAMIDLELQSPQ